MVFVQRVDETASHIRRGWRTYCGRWAILGWRRNDAEMQHVCLTCVRVLALTYPLVEVEYDRRMQIVNGTSQMDRVDPTGV
jgi:hypothetical protein